MDPSTLGQLLDEHGPALVLYARQWATAPEDVVQEAFVKLACQRKAPDKVLPWLYRTVRNGAISQRRSWTRRHRHERAAASLTEAWFSGEDAATRLDGEAAAAALKELPEQTREIITLHLWGGLTFAEIAEVVRMPTTTAHRLYQGGLQALRGRLNRCPRTPETT